MKLTSLTVCAILMSLSILFSQSTNNKFADFKKLLQTAENPSSFDNVFSNHLEMLQSKIASKDISISQLVNELDFIIIEENIRTKNFYLLTLFLDTQPLSLYEKIELCDEALEQYTIETKLTDIDSFTIGKIYFQKSKLYNDLGQPTISNRTSYLSLSYSDDYLSSLFYSLPAKIKISPSNETISNIQQCYKAYEQYGAIYFLNETRLHLANCYTKLNQKDSAYLYFDELDYSYINLNFAYSSKAESYHFFNEPLKEEKALLNLNNSQKNSYNPDPLLKLGSYYLRQNNIDKSKFYFKQALHLTLLNNDEENLILNENAYCDAQINLAKIKLLNDEKVDKEFLLNIRTLILNKFNSLQFQKDKINLLKRYIDLLSIFFQFSENLDFNSEALLEFSEEAKAFSLFDELQKDKLLKKTISSEEYEDIIEKNKRVYEKDKLISKLLSKKKIDSAELSKLKRGQLNIQDSIDQLLNAVSYQKTNTPTLKQIAEDNPEKSILEYFIQDTIGYCLLVQDNQISKRRLKLNKQIIAQLEELKVLMTNSESNLDSLKAYSQMAYECLVSPFATKLKQDVIIVPHGEISSIPFELLVDEKGNFLIETINISYAYSLSVLQEMKLNSSQTNQNHLLAFAPEYTSSLPNYSFSSLSQSNTEVKSVAAHFKNKQTFHDKSASKKNFLLNYKDANIIHIAAHADVDPYSNDLSYLAFTDATKNVDSSLLFLTELNNIKLQSDMIVLSACNTGIGRYEAGEGILSLARGFVQAGTASIVSSLWEADDTFTAEIMGFFYQFLSTGKSKDEALADAKRTYLENAVGKNRHPFYWAGFVLIGDTKPIFKNHYWLAKFILIGIGFVSFYFLFRRKFMKPTI